MAEFGVLVLIVALSVNFLKRPEDTTDVSIFEQDGTLIDYCDLPELDGNGLKAVDIPKAYTPGCGYERFPMPVLADCREPLATGVTDLRGLWLAKSGIEGHIERVEQCGNRTVVTSSSIIHDFMTDGSLENGAHDVSPPNCTNIRASVEFNNGAMELSPFGLANLVTRRLEGDELVWEYVGKTTRLKRICKFPEGEKGLFVERNYKPVGSDG